MDNQTDEQKLAARKRRIRLIAILFFGMLIVVTLYSNTLLNLTLPKVITGQPAAGNLAHTYQGNATVRPVQEADLQNPAGWKVSKVLVKEGDAVHKGQALVNYDSSDAQSQLEDAQAAMKKLKLSVSMLQFNYIQAAQSEDQAAKLNAQNALESAQIDIATQEQHLEALQKTIGENQQLLAPFDGIVTHVNAMEGLSGSPAGPDIQLSNTGLGFQFELQVPAAIASGLKLGDKLEAKLSEDGNRAIQGSIAEIKDTVVPDNGGQNASGETQTPAAANQLVIKVQDKSLHGGERIQVDISQSSQDDDSQLVPSQAIREDSSGAYVYVVEERQGPLGNAFYAARRSVKVTDSNEFQTAVSGLFDQEQIIIESSEPIQEGSRVRL
ncbi:efflux RND transporter periplasmic adaptor subunit [Paenibacillus sepulcri]